MVALLALQPLVGYLLNLTLLERWIDSVIVRLTWTAGVFDVNA
jgi:hypothetical protein